jgi:hypothetical protein
MKFRNSLIITTLGFGLLVGGSIAPGCGDSGGSGGGTAGNNNQGGSTTHQGGSNTGGSNTGGTTTNSGGSGGAGGSGGTASGGGGGEVGGAGACTDKCDTDNPAGSKTARGIVYYACACAATGPCAMDGQPCADQMDETTCTADMASADKPKLSQDPNMGGLSAACQSCIADQVDSMNACALSIFTDKDCGAGTDCNKYAMCVLACVSQ